MQITSNNTMIFVKEDENGKKHYRAGLSTKNKDGEYENGYIDVRMPKDVEIENKTKINITNGFLSFYNYKDKEGKNKTIWYIVVQTFTTGDSKAYIVEDIKAEEIDDLPLPF